MKMNKQHQFITTVSHKVNNKKNFRQLIAMGGMVICSSVYALDEQFNDALRAASSGNLALLDQYQYEMQNDALGYYPEYWKLNNNLGLQPASSIISFAQRYPQSAPQPNCKFNVDADMAHRLGYALWAPVN